MNKNYKNALISVSDKTHLLKYASLLSKSGTRIVSTGGTLKFLSSSKIPAGSVEDQTGFPEVMGGRVKTLHPHIFLPLLARSNHLEDDHELSKRSLSHFDLVICNLYPFEKLQAQNEKEQMEWVDVGGPSMLRAGAKNFEKITVICDPCDYPILEKPTNLETRRMLAQKVFSHLSLYDSMVADYLRKNSTHSNRMINIPYTLGGSFLKSLRYGENPHQKSRWYHRPFQKGLEEAQVIQGKDLSFNNLLDIQAAVSTLREFPEIPSFVAVKHNNPCSVTCDSSLTQAVHRGVQADPLSIFGGVVALNQEVDLKSSQLLTNLFLECIVAPSFSKQALDLFSKKKNLRILSWKNLMDSKKESTFHTIDGGLIIQDSDDVQIDWSQYKIHGFSPTDLIRKDLEMAWKVCAHLKSNAICLVSQGQTVGMGMGQVDRITSVELAFQRMNKYHPRIQTEVVMASDGFFPFSDSVEKAAGEGVKWIIQPGGSIKDKEVIRQASKLGVSIILTGKRHFKH